MLQEYGFFDARITQDVLLHRTTKRAEVTFNIRSGAPARVGSLTFSGKPFFSEAVLRKTIKTTPGRRFREFEFKRDLERIEAIHDKDGFLEHDIKVAEQDATANSDAPGNHNPRRQTTDPCRCTATRCPKT